jgi:FkbM family methyltransferase
MNDEEYVSTLYRTLLAREPDPGGLAHYVALMAANDGPREVLNSITSSEEYLLKSAKLPKTAKPLVSYRPSRPLVIVDVGAQNLANESHIYAPLMQLPNRCIGFEPLENKRIEREDGTIEMLPHFIGDGSEQTFYVNNDDATSSLLPLNEEFNSHHNHLSGLRTLRTERVKTSRLDDVLSDVGRVDFLKLDIQGFEGPALLGAQKVLQRTNVVHCEVEFAPIYKGTSVFSEIERLLAKSGFYFVDFTHLCRYAYEAVPDPTTTGERLGWADAVFFREHTETDDDALAQAAVAELVYGKSGLAKHLTSSITK